MKNREMIQMLKKSLNIVDPNEELQPPQEQPLLNPLSAASRIIALPVNYRAPEEAPDPAQQQPQPAQPPQAFKNEDTLKERTLDTETKRIDPEMLAEEITPAIMRSPQIKSQNEGINLLTKLKSEWLDSQSGRRDYAPTIAFIDKLTGGNQLKSYNRPSSYDDLHSALFEREMQIQKAKDAMADNIANLLNASKEGQTQTLMEALSQRMIGNGLRAPQVNNPMEKVWSVFSKQGQKFTDQIYASGEARKLLNEGRTISDQMLRRALIRLSGDTRPSDKDVDAFGGDSRLLEKAQQWYDSKFDTGTFSQSNREQIASMINSLENLSRKRLRESAINHAKVAGTFQPSLAAMSPAEISNALISRALAEPPQPTQESEKTKQAPKTTGSKPKQSSKFTPKSDDELNKMSGPELESYLKSLSRKK